MHIICSFTHLLEIRQWLNVHHQLLKPFTSKKNKSQKVVTCKHVSNRWAELKSGPCSCFMPGLATLFQYRKHTRAVTHTCGVLTHVCSHAHTHIYTSTRAHREDTPVPVHALTMAHHVSNDSAFYKVNEITCGLNQEQDFKIKCP